VSSSEALWLEPAGGPSAAELSERRRWWEARSDSFRAHAPAALHADADRRERPAEAHGLCERYLPLDSLRGDLFACLRAWFGPALDELEVDLATSSLGRARSWLDARAELPSLASGLPAELFVRCAAAASAHALLFELFCSPRLGAALTRYPAQLSAIGAALAGESGRALRIWDAGCATGEGTWALARAARDAGASRVAALGTTPWPLELLCAQRRAFPHDPQRTAQLRAALEGLDEASCALSFARHDLRQPPPGRDYDLVACHGVLGGVVQGALPDDLRRLAGAVASGGLLSVTDAFREDRHAAVARALAELGWRELAPGLLRKP